MTNVEAFIGFASGIVTLLSVLTLVIRRGAALISEIRGILSSHQDLVSKVGDVMTTLEGVVSSMDSIIQRIEALENGTPISPHS